ncbi:MAG: UbiA family prenyltransferase [Acidobacteria bacterium]|nr:UbiA family prenyltransferase [Acidobacteriota bacterium]
MKMKKIGGLYRLLRFELPFAAGVCVVLGQLFALGAFPPMYVALAAFLSIFSISASILVLNDCLDVETDRINAPSRPIPSGMVTRTEALGLSALLAGAGLLLGFALGAAPFALAFLLLLVGFLYDRWFKKSGLPGNLMVAFSVGMTFVYGGVSVGEPWNGTVWFLALIAALLDLGEEIAADATDMTGDRLIQSRSLALTYGRRTALRISGSLFLLVILLTPLPFLLRWFTPVYVFPIALMDIAIARPALLLVRSGHEETDDDAARRHIRLLYLGASGGLLLFLVMRLAGA